LESALRRGYGTSFQNYWIAIYLLGRSALDNCPKIWVDCSDLMNHFFLLDVNDPSLISWFPQKKNPDSALITSVEYFATLDISTERAPIDIRAHIATILSEEFLQVRLPEVQPKGEQSISELLWCNRSSRTSPKSIHCCSMSCN
jgi:hypothetical protein